MFGFLNKKTPEQPAAAPQEDRVFRGVVKDDERFHEDTLKFLVVLCGVLSKSYGPLGSNTLIENDGKHPIITKDGYTILENLSFMKAQDIAIHQLIKRVSYNLVKTVGDGSTSAVLSACFMYEALSDMRETVYTRKQFLDVLDRIVVHLEKEISDNLTHRITGDNKHRVLKAISNISNNNDLKIGDYIANVFSNLSYLSDVRIEEDPKDSTDPISHTVRHGFTFEKGPSHNLYLGNKPTVSVSKPIVFMSYEFFPDHYEAIKKVQAANPTIPIIVITEQTHQETLNDCWSDFMRGANKVHVIKTFDLANPGAHEEFLDLAIYLDADIVRDPATFKFEQLGSCSMVELHGTKCVFLSGQGLVRGTEFYNQRLQQLQEEFDEVSINQPAQRGALRVRISKLNGVSVRILVGGITEEEKKMRRFLVEDAVLACKSALNKGYGFGGNISLFFAANRVRQNLGYLCVHDEVLAKYDEDYVATIMDRLVEVYYSTFKCIVSKDPTLDEDDVDSIRERLESDDTQMYDALDRSFKGIDDTNVLAPIDTDVQILKASVSIVGMLLSINQLVS
jgi:chaperonin GroEL (HSP60 family)